MRVNLNEIDAVEMHNYKQGNGKILSKIVLDGRRKMMYHTIKKGSSVGYHKHDEEHEIIYILSGKASIKLEDESLEIGSHEFYIFKPKTYHGIENKYDDDLVFIAIVYK